MLDQIEERYDMIHMKEWIVLILTGKYSNLIEMSNVQFIYVL